MGGALWRFGTQEEGCTNHSFIQSRTALVGLCAGCVLNVERGHDKCKGLECLKGIRAELCILITIEWLWAPRMLLLLLSTWLCPLVRYA
jgi:hypothetical protein